MGRAGHGLAYGAGDAERGVVVRISQRHGRGQMCGLSTGVFFVVVSRLFGKRFKLKTS